MSGPVMFSALLMSHGNLHKLNLFFFSPYRHRYGLMESIIGISWVPFLNSTNLFCKSGKLGNENIKDEKNTVQYSHIIDYK